MSPHSQPPAAAATTRTPVEFDPATGGLRIGPHERRIADPGKPEQFYRAYLSLLYAVRNARPGQRLALRSADLEALLLLVGDDPDTIESRLVGLMGCTPEEATTLARLLLRQRKTTAALGIAGLSLAGIGLGGQLPGGGSEPVPVSQTVGQSVGQSIGQSLLQSTSSVAGDTELPAVGPATSPVEASAVEPVAAAPVAPVTVGPVADRSPSVPQPAVATSVVVAEAPAPAPRPVAPVLAAPQAAPVEQPAAAPPAPEVADADRYVMPLHEEPVWDAPPPPVDEPLSDIGEAVSVVAEPATPISGVTESGRELPAEPETEPLSDIGEAVSLDADPVAAEPQSAAPTEQISGVTDSTHDVPAVPATDPPAAGVADPR